MSSLKIAFIGARGVVGTYSGIETYYEEVGSRLAARGHEVTAYCRSYFTPDVESHRGVKVRRLPCLRSKHLETISHSVLATLDCLFRDFHIVQYHAIGSAPLALVPRVLSSKKTVVSVRGLDWQRAKWGWFARKVLQAGEWASVRCPSATAVVSESLQRHFEREHGRRPAMIPNAVVLGEHRPLQRLRELGLESGEFLLFAARISPEKGLHDLLEAWGRVPGDKTLVVAGGTSYTSEYIEEVRAAAPKNVAFIGRVGRETMEELYSHCYAYVLPSYMEGLSIGLLEAVSYGCCVVSTNIPENLEVVGESAATFPPGDVETLAEILGGLVADPAKAQDYRDRALAHALIRPDWDEVTRRTESLYRRLVEGGSSGTG